MIDISSLTLLKGKKALVTGIANDQSIAWGCAKAFHALGADVAVTYLNDKSKPYVEPLAKEIGAPIFMPLDLQKEGQLEAVFDTHRQEVGQARPVPALDRLCAEGGPAGPRRRLLEEGISAGDGDLVLVVHPHGQARGAPDEGRRHALHHDLLRLADGGGALQHHGPGQGRAGSRRPATWRPNSAPRASGCTRSRQAR